MLAAEVNEVTEYFIYSRLSESAGGSANAGVLRRIAADEFRHYEFWKKQTGVDVKPDLLKVWWYRAVSRLFGLTFGVKLMENGEKGAQLNYKEISKTIPQALQIAEDEEKHEKELLGMLDEGRLRYVGSIVLGLNDALVEFTGALAGFTFALQNTRVVAATGLIMGFAASLSMASSEYLSKKSEGVKNPVKASAYTGLVYMLTVLLLVLPYMLFPSALFSLACTLATAVAVICVFTYYTSVAKDLPFKSRFMEMTAISLGVSALTFAISYAVKAVFGIEA